MKQFAENRRRVKCPMSVRDYICRSLTVGKIFYTGFNNPENYYIIHVWIPELVTCLTQKQETINSIWHKIRKILIWFITESKTYFPCRHEVYEPVILVNICFYICLRSFILRPVCKKFSDQNSVWIFIFDILSAFMPNTTSIILRP